MNRIYIFKFKFIGGSPIVCMSKKGEVFFNQLWGETHFYFINFIGQDLQISLV